MNYSDFLMMDADAFNAVVSAYSDSEEYKRRDEWERVRQLATFSIQPYLSKKHSVSPEKLFPLPWDNEKHKSSMSAESQQQRMKKLFEQVGANI